MQTNKKYRNWIMIISILLIALTIFFIYNSANKTETLTYGEFREKVVNGEVSRAYAKGTVIRVRLVDSEITIEDFEREGSSSADFIVTLADKEAFITFMGDYKSGEVAGATVVADFDYDYQYAQESFFSQILPYVGIIIMIVIAFIVIKNISNVNNKSMSFGKSRASMTENNKVRFGNVAGAKEEKEELVELVDFLKNPKKYTDLGARIPKGVLLVGPPGTGKTLLAKAVAGESNVPFFSISGSDFVEMFVGVGASRVRDLFDQAKRNRPCIVFIDEIDAVGRQRGAGLGGGNDEREQTLNQLLVEMDGFEANEGIIIMAATNRPDVLDPALLRPGRFDRQIYVNMPDAKAREEILKVHAKNKAFGDDVNLKAIARLTSGFSGADLENVLNEAAILTARDNRPTITMVDINEAVNKVLLGPQKRSRVYTDRDKKITAYHEAGHAIIQKVLPECDEVHEVSIIPRGMAGGYTMTRPDNDDLYATHNKLLAKITSYMGGRVSEELIFKDVTTGASSDIQEATKIARKMVTEFGMSDKLNFINLGDGQEVFLGRDYQTQVNYSESTASVIDQEIQKILNSQYEKAKQILTDNMDKLEVMTELLLKKETIYKEEVDLIMEGKTVKQILRIMNRKEKLQSKKVEEQKKKKQEEEEKKLLELKLKAFTALQNQGIISKSASFDDFVKGKKVSSNDNNETLKTHPATETSEETTKKTDEKDN